VVARLAQVEQATPLALTLLVGSGGGAEPDGLVAGA